jgi:hypothetical protein
MIDTTDTQDPQDPDAIFVQARGGFYLFEEKLRPYSASRKVAAQSMGLMYPYIGEEGAAQFASTGVYPGAMKDTIILLWLCSLPDDGHGKTWTPSRALAKPAEAIRVALDWASDLELCTPGSSRFTEAFRVFVEITTAIEASRFSVSVDGATSSQEDAGPNV